MSEKKKLVPKRRFKEFENADPWEQRTLEKLTCRYDNLRIPVTASQRIPGNVPYYGANGIQDYVKGFTHNGEFVLIAEDGANDVQDYPVHYVNGKVWINNHAHVIQAKIENANNKFLVFLLKNFEIEPYLVGGGRLKLNADTMMKFSFNVPQVKEQEKIGDFLIKIENLITLHQRAHLTIYYKGVVKWLIKLEKPTYLLIIILNGLKFIKKALLEKLRCQNIE